MRNELVLLLLKQLVKLQLDHINLAKVNKYLPLTVDICIIICVKYRNT